MKPEACIGCPLYELGSGFVPGAGRSNADLVFVFDHPSDEDVKMGQPLAGGMGRVLYALCGDSGFSKNEVFITNTIRCRPKRNVDLRAVMPSAAAHCRTYLDAELQQHPNANLVVFGDVPLKAILNEKGITKHRGCVYEWEGRWVMPTLPLQTIVKETKSWPVACSDLTYAHDELKTHREGERNFVIRPTFADVLSWFDSTPNDVPLYVDIETYGDALACIGFARNETDAICVPLWNGSTWYWTDPTDAYRVVEIMARRLSDRAQPKVFQNGAFDVAFLENLGFTIDGWTEDTMLMHHTVYSELKHGLGFLHSIYVREAYYKGMNHSDKDEVDE